MKRRIYVDLFYLNTALTGIQTYMLEFCEAVSTYPHSDIEWVFSHDPKKQASASYFRGKQPKWKTLLYHAYYFLWKQVILPYRAKKAQTDSILNFDFVGPAFTRRKNYTVIHDAFFWQMPQNYSGLWRTYFIQSILSGLRRDSCVITTSRVAKKALEKNTPIFQIPQVIYQCPKLYEGDADTFTLKRLGISKNTYFFHLGSFDKRKNLPLLVEAFALFLKDNPSSMSLVLAGERGLGKTVDDWSMVEEKIKEFNLHDRVLLTGFVSNNEAKSLYQGALAYVFPSQNEGFGIPVIEAMRAGIPVIISDQEALVEIADGAALIHQTGNVVDLKEKMESLYRNPELRAQLVQKGSVRKELFTRAAFAEAYHNLILNF
ncbi:glycosyltransferase family 4 protein [Mongoliitalea daihaiensis]|uniref:glycosyltransferase family 4 protein n=1 Tax=Mongoliitalea daihaiensis TaxID=2782006 RepID=UPI001F3AE050|nr:glycosyltransferase family 1 protein [Mongoliitalea daihaiensis]UJP65995.1 glycosyltransferase family 4 protein [Mongoliitalea daihaiensis]